MNITSISCTVLLLSALPLCASELLKNPDFKRKLDGWEVRLAQEYRASKMPTPLVVRGKGGEKNFFYIDMPHKSGMFYARLEQPVKAVKGTAYLLKLDIRADQPGEVGFWLSQYDKENEPLVNGLARKITAEADWAHHEVIFRVPEVNTAEPVFFRAAFGLCEGVVEVRDVSLTDMEDQSVEIKDLRRGDVVEVDTPPASATPSAEVRTWKSTSGATLEGEFVSYAASMVTLKDPSNGKEFKIRLMNLSRADQLWVRQNATWP